MWAHRWAGFLGVLASGTAVAGPTKVNKRIEVAVPAVNAAEIPVLAGLLNKAGWTPTPELSGVFQVGRIFKDDGTGHSLMVRDCFDGEVGSDSYTSSEVVSHLQAGVRVGLGLKVKASGSMVRKVRFDVESQQHTPCNTKSRAAAPPQTPGTPGVPQSACGWLSCPAPNFGWNAPETPKGSKPKGGGLRA